MGVLRIVKWLVATVVAGVIAVIVGIAFTAYGVEDGLIRILQRRWESAMPEWLGLLFTPSVFILGIVAGAAIESRIRAREAKCASPEPDWDDLHSRMNRLWDALGRALFMKEQAIPEDTLGELVSLQKDLQMAGVKFNLVAATDPAEMMKRNKVLIGMMKGPASRGQVELMNQILAEVASPE